MMVLNHDDGSIENRRFFDIVDFLREGDVLVFNDSRVIPARLFGRKVDTGGKVEILLLRRLDTNIWEALVKPGKRFRTGARVEIINNSTAGRQPETGALIEVIELRQDGIKVISVSDETQMLVSGKVPLPPYIDIPLADPERYQTVYAKIAGSAAAPTAGLHFTPSYSRISPGKECNASLLPFTSGWTPSGQLERRTRAHTRYTGNTAS